MLRRLLFIGLAALALLFPVGEALAYSLADPAPGFGPDQYQNLVSDLQFTAVDMTAGDISAFFSKQGNWTQRDGGVSWLAGYQIPEYQNVPYKYKDDQGNCQWSSISVRQYYDTGNEPLYGTDVATLIAQKSAEFTIAAEVILATLEKESSAVSRTTPQSTAVEMWVLGFGWNDTMAACGYNQAQAQSRANAYGGVGQQITYAMSSQFGFRKWYDQYINTYGNPFTSGDGGNITPANRSTKALYVYTPYVYNGNYNFWYFFHTWFINNSRAFSREGQLVKGSGPAVYVKWPSQNKRWYLSSMDAAISWGIQNLSVTILSDSDLQAIPLGNGTLTRLVKRTYSEPVYYIEGGTKFHVKTDKIFPLYNMNWSELSTVDDILLDQSPSGHPIGMLARSVGRDEVYLITYNRKYYVPNETMLHNWGYNWGDISFVTQGEIDAYPTAGSFNYLVQIEGSDRVYAMSDGQRLYIPSQAVLQAWNLNFGMINQLGIELGYVLSAGPDLTRVVKGSGPKVYYIQSGKRRYVSSESRLRSVGASLSQLITVSDTMLNRLALGSNL